MGLMWTEPGEIAWALIDAHPETDPLDLNFVDLHRLIVALPDFVANSGGVHLYESLQPDDDAPTALARIEAIVGTTTVRVLEAARAGGVTPMAAALEDGRRWLLEAVPSGADLVEELFPAS